MFTKPRWLLQLEGAAILWLALYFYYSNHFSWWLFALLFLTPDLFMLGYLIDAKWKLTHYAQPCGWRHTRSPRATIFGLPKGMRTHV